MDGCSAAQAGEGKMYQNGLQTSNERTNLALGAGHLVQGLPLVGLGGKVELPQGDLHLPDPVRLRDLVPVKHLQHYRLLGHVSQRHLWVDSTVFSSISGFLTHFELEGLIECWVKSLLDDLGLQLLKWERGRGREDQIK